MFDRVVELHYM